MTRVNFSSPILAPTNGFLSIVVAPPETFVVRGVELVEGINYDAFRVTSFIVGGADCCANPESSDVSFADFAARVGDRRIRLGARRVTTLTVRNQTDKMLPFAVWLFGDADESPFLAVDDAPDDARWVLSTEELCLFLTADLHSDDAEPIADEILAREGKTHFPGPVRLPACPPDACFRCAVCIETRPAQETKRYMFLRFLQRNCLRCGQNMTFANDP